MRACRATTDTQDTGGEATSTAAEFVDCPFLGHRWLSSVFAREHTCGCIVMHSVCPLIGQAAAGALRAAGKAPVVAHGRRHFTPNCCPPPCRYYGPVRELFRTTLGQVYLARNKESGQQVVIKMIERGPAVSKHVETELLIHRQVPPGGGGPAQLHAGSRRCVSRSAAARQTRGTAGMQQDLHAGGGCCCLAPPTTNPLPTQPACSSALSVERSAARTG